MKKGTSEKKNVITRKTLYRELTVVENKEEGTARNLKLRKTK